MEFSPSFRSLLPLFSVYLWRLCVSPRYTSFTKSTCIDLVKAVAYGTGGPYGRAAPELALVKLTGASDQKVFN